MKDDDSMIPGKHPHVNWCRRGKRGKDLTGPCPDFARTSYAVRF